MSELKLRPPEPDSCNLQTLNIKDFAQAKDVPFRKMFGTLLPANSKLQQLAQIAQIC